MVGVMAMGAPAASAGVRVEVQQGAWAAAEVGGCPGPLMAVDHWVVSYGGCDIEAPEVILDEGCG